MARGAKVILSLADCDSGVGVDDIAIGMPAQAEVEDHVSTRNGVSRIPIALHPVPIARTNMIKCRWKLVTDKVVLRRKHVSWSLGYFVGLPEILFMVGFT